MKTNVGGFDRIVRFIGGFVILGAGIYYKSWWGLLSIPILFSAIFRLCIGYLPFGLSSARAKLGFKP